MMSHQGLALFFTLSVSLDQWAQAGFLSREVVYYQRLAKAIGEITFITYGGEKDVEIAAGLESINLLNNPWHLTPRHFASVAIWRYRKSLRGIPLVKTNQIRGAWAGLPAKWLLGKKLVVRGGYLPSLHRAREGAGLRERTRLWCEEAISLWAADRILVATEEMANRICRTYKISRNKIHIIPNFIETELFAPKSNVQPAERLVGYVGRLIPRKNVEALVDAAAQLDNVSLQFIGDGPLRLPLEQKARELGVKLEFSKNIPNSEVPHYLSRCQVFAFPTLYEGHPKALLEAMACQLPIVTTPVSGVENLIQHRQTGYLCKDTSVEGLRDGLKEVLENAALGQHMAKNARQFVIRHFSLDRVLEKELAVYQEMGII